MNQMLTRFLATSLTLWVVGCGGGAKSDSDAPKADTGSTNTVAESATKNPEGPAAILKAAPESAETTKLSEREVAEHVLLLGGEVGVLVNGERKIIRPGGGHRISAGDAWLGGRPAG